MERLTFILLLNLLATLGPVFAQDDICGENWSHSNETGYCYQFFPTMKNWTDAENYCDDNSADLASIHSPNEQDFIKRLIQNSENEAIWIGGYEYDNANTWEWSDGTAFDFNDWPSNQEFEQDLDSSADPEKCISMSKAIDWKWESDLCSDLFPFVCKRGPLLNEADESELETTVAPVTVSILGRRDRRQTCPDEWFQDPRTGSCFLILDDCLSFEAASAKCKESATSAELATIRSPFEERFITGYVYRANRVKETVGSFGFWIGGKAENVRRRAKWIWANDQSPIYYTDWAYRRTFPRIGKCIKVAKYRDGWKWFSEDCRAGMQAICKIPNT